MTSGSMSLKIWTVLHIFFIGCVTIEVGVFLRMLDDKLTLKLASPNMYNSSQLFKDMAAYSFSIKRLFKLFKLHREHIMDTAKWVYTTEHPNFIKKISCEKVKSDFSLTDREYKDLLHFLEKITSTLSEFYKACEQNPKFVGIPLAAPEFSLEKLSAKLETMFKYPNNKFKKSNVLTCTEEYYYNLGKFTKKFTLGRRAVMERAKALFECGGPQFLKYYNYFKIQEAYGLTVIEAASLDTLIGKIRRRYSQFTSACSKNIYFQSKVDFSSIRIVRICEKSLRNILAEPSPQFTSLLFKQIKEFYHVLGFLRRSNIPNRTELLQVLYGMFGKNYPAILKPLNFAKIKSDFELEEGMVEKLEQYIDHLRRRFDQVQQLYLQPNMSQFQNTI